MGSKFQIRDFCQGDYDSLVDLWKVTGMGGEERGDDKDVIQATIEAGGRLFVMHEEGVKLIGSSWLSHDQRRMYIHHFAIHPDFQGRGLSKILLDKCLDYCRLVGLQVKLEVHKDNHRALNLYKSYGFSDLDGYDVLIARDIAKKKP